MSNEQRDWIDEVLDGFTLGSVLLTDPNSNDMDLDREKLAKALRVRWVIEQASKKEDLKSSKPGWGN